eukprot:4813093-Pleurochrysis_carterae.AAC.1
MGTGVVLGVSESEYTEVLSSVPALQLIVVTLIYVHRVARLAVPLKLLHGFMPGFVRSLLVVTAPSRAGGDRARAAPRRRRARTLLRYFTPHTPSLSPAARPRPSLPAPALAPPPRACQSQPPKASAPLPSRPSPRPRPVAPMD